MKAELIWRDSLMEKGFKLVGQGFRNNLVVEIYEADGSTLVDSRWFINFRDEGYICMIDLPKAPPKKRLIALISPHYM